MVIPDIQIIKVAGQIQDLLLNYNGALHFKEIVRVLNNGLGPGVKGYQEAYDLVCEAVVFLKKQGLVREQGDIYETPTGRKIERVGISATAYLRK